MHLSNISTAAVIAKRSSFSQYRLSRLTHVLLIAGALFGLLPMTHAIDLPPGDDGTNSIPSYIALDTWSVFDSTNWTSDDGYAPVSFTNLAHSDLGTGSALVVDTNLPAWLQFNVIEADGTTNFSPSVGTISFWFAPQAWSSTSAGGSGPDEYGRLFDAGSYTADSSFGWFSLYIDPAGDNLFFSTQTNDLSSTVTTYLSAPISWQTNYFHNVVLTYSQTNTTLYLDGALITNGPGLTVYPGTNVGTFNIGSDATGVYQSDGLFNSVETYGVPLDPGTIQQTFSQQIIYYFLSPWNTAMGIQSAVSAAITYSPGNEVFTGSGNLSINPIFSPIQISSTNPYVVWMTNVLANASANGTSITFTVEGGQPGYFYDVFVTGALASPITNCIWSWQGQAQQWQVCTLTNIPNSELLILLGTPQDSDGDGLTDAYELLVSHTNPNSYSSDGTGMSDGWEIFYFGHTGVDPNADPDGDGLTNYQEYMGGTNPLIKDNYKAPLMEPKPDVNLP
jgi:hypothetical protein